MSTVWASTTHQDPTKDRNDAAGLTGRGLRRVQSRAVRHKTNASPTNPRFNLYFTDVWMTGRQGGNEQSREPRGSWLLKGGGARNAKQRPDLPLALFRAVRNVDVYLLPPAPLAPGEFGLPAPVGAVEIEGRRSGVVH